MSAGCTKTHLERAGLAFRLPVVSANRDFVDLWTYRSHSGWFDAKIAWGLREVRLESEGPLAFQAVLVEQVQTYTKCSSGWFPDGVFCFSPDGFRMATLAFRMVGRNVPATVPRSRQYRINLTFGSGLASLQRAWPPSKGTCTRVPAPPAPHAGRRRRIQDAAAAAKQFD